MEADQTKVTGERCPIRISKEIEKQGLMETKRKIRGPIERIKETISSRYRKYMPLNTFKEILYQCGVPRTGGRVSQEGMGMR